MPTVEVWGKRIEVDVHQKSKSVWIASGEYLGKRFDASDRSQNSALKRWQEAARSRGG